MRLNAIVDNFARSSTNGSISGFEQSERHVPIVLEGESLPDHGRDLDCIAAESHPLYARLVRQFLSWSKRRVMPELDARTQYDIGENDCRPPQAKPTNAYSASFEAMLNRSI
jgi:hypothetical protein